MNSSQSIRFPATEIPVTATSLGMETSAVLQHPSNGVAAIGRGKNSSNVPPPALPTHHSVDWMMRTPPPKPSRVTSSPSSTELAKGRDDTRRSRGNSLARSIAGPLSRLLHFDGKEVDHGELDFMCRGEVPLRPPTSSRMVGESRGSAGKSRDWDSRRDCQRAELCWCPWVALGSAWCPENGWTKAGDLPTVTSPFGGSPPPLASSGSSPSFG
ncbi:hypothetical protein DFH28DRAFT_929725 [Melampsora americana]|nr:hypothetical protein DFH28DRAFT_929725 [Melampsora americana]